MANGFIETGQEVMWALKQGSIVDADREAGEAMEQSMRALVGDILLSEGTTEQKVRRGYTSGVLHGIRIAGIWDRMRLRQLRFEEGRDPETGKPMKKES